MIIVWIHDATQNYSMSVLYKQKIYSIELERLIWIKTGIYKNKNTDHCYEQYKLWEHTYIKKDSMTLWDYWVFLMFNYFAEYLDFKKEDIDLLVVSSWKDYKSIFWNIEFTTPKSHHLMHLYSTYFLSWFTESNILIIDWAGYDLEENKIALQSLYFWKWKDIKNINTNYAKKEKNIWIWIAYERVSYFLWLTEWKIMWLSWYWQKYTKYDFFDLKNNEVYLKTSLHQIFCDKELFLKHYWLMQEFSQNWYQSEKIIDFVYSFQVEVEEAILHLANNLYEINPCENLCYAWWVALNCLTNYRLKNELKYKNIFIQPAAWDSWISLWNLLYGYYTYLNQVEKIWLSDTNYWLWINYNNEIENILSDYQDYIDFEKIENENDFINHISESINAKKVSIIYRWWSEFWPRALWNRSIIASVKIPDLQYKINKIKDRELWRPFWMMILKADQDKYFENSVDSKYMLFTNKLNQEWLKIYNNICHNDHSIRLQTIFEDNEFYFKLLNRLKYYWVKWLLNTSLNWKGQPILETPNQAIEFFLIKEWIEKLFLENYVITKKIGKKITSKKLSNNTLVNNVLNNMKMIFIKKTRFTIENIFIDIDIFTKNFTVNIVKENESIWKIEFKYEKDKYFLDKKTGIIDNDFSILILNVVDNSDFLNKLFWMLRWVFIKSFH